MKSKAYWVKRAVEVETYLQSHADSIKDGVIKAYERAIRNINGDIERTFKAYISTDIPEKEARRLMSIADSDKQYEELLELYAETDDKTVKKEILNRINAQSYGARISRLEGLKRNVYIYFRHVANEAIKEQKKLYDSAVKTAYYTNIFDTAQGLNCGIDFSLVPQKAVNMVLSEPWHGHNYSERVWIHNDRFIQAVGQTIEDGIISGHSVSRMTDKLIDYVKDTAPGGIRTSAETLVRSETAHFMNQGQRMAYEEIGIKQYRFVAALSELTCDTCGNLDGSVFDTDKAVEGENFPPIHPRCRCVTIMADVNLTSRIARDPLTGENYKVDGSMTFNEWKNSLSDEQKNALKYVANSEKRGIIKIDKEQFRKLTTEEKARETLHFISKERFDQLTIEARKNGATIIRGGEEVNRHLDNVNAAAAIIGDVILFRNEVCVSEVLEETYHFKQNLNGLNDGHIDREILNEIDAKKWLITVKDKYKIPREEHELNKAQLEFYKKELIKRQKERGEIE